MLRNKLQDYEDKYPNRMVQCQYCSKEEMHKEVTAMQKLFIDKCEDFPISCPNNCAWA